MPSRVFRFWEANQIIPAIIGFIPVYVMDIPAVKVKTLDIYTRSYLPNIGLANSTESPCDLCQAESFINAKFGK